MRKIGFITGMFMFVLLIGCNDTKIDGDSSAVPDNYFNETAVLQGTIVDAVTGDRITDTSLTVTLVRGTKYQNAAVRTGSATFAGDYSLSGIPISINAQTQYRIAVMVTGYQPFEAAIGFNANTGSGTLDRNYNYVGNIYVFPLGATANDVAVNVSFNAEAVEGAIVLLRAQAGNNRITADTSNIYQAANNGFIGSQSATTDVNGDVTFVGANLVLGGEYVIEVLPASHEGIALAQTTGNTIVIGASNIMQNVALTELVPGTSEGLYVVSASNSDSNVLDASGVLTIVFSRAISLMNESLITATLANNTTAALDATAAPDSGVTGALSADGLTLTLTPVFATNPLAFDGSNAATADDGLTVTFSNTFVRLQSSNDTAEVFDVFNTLVNQAGVNPDDTVNITLDFQ